MNPVRVLHLFFMTCFILFFSIEAEAQEIDPSLLNGAHSVVLSEKSHISFERFNSYRFRYNQKTLILNRKAKRDESIYIFYKEGSDKIKEVSIILRDADGTKIREIDANDITDHSSTDGYSIITDGRVKYWKSTHNQYPYIIELSYTKTSNSTFNFPSWRPIAGYNSSVLHSEFTIETPLKIRSKKLNIEDYPSITQDGYRYTMTEQPALRKEKYSPAAIDIFPMIVHEPSHFVFEGIEGEFETWEGFGKWYHTNFMLDKKLRKPEKVQSELTAIIGSSDSKREIAEKIYSFVQEQTRYVSINLDEGGLNPMSPQKVHEVKYGDCKALSLYMHHLLKLYDIESNYVVVHADTEYPVNLFEDFPGAFPGNHAILQVPIEQDTVWLDCTSSINPFGYLGSFTDDRMVYCIGESGGHLTRTPNFPIEQNKRVVEVRLHVQPSGHAMADVVIKKSGLRITEDIALSRESKDVQEKVIREAFTQHEIRNMTEISFEYEKESQSSQMKFNLDIPYYAEVAGDYLFVPNSISNMEIPVLPKDKKRDQRIYFPRGHSIHSTIDIKFDQEVEAIETADEEFKSPYGHYSKTTVQTDQGVKVVRSFVLNKGTYPKSEYADIKSFFDQCLKSGQQTTTIQYK